MGNSTGEIAEVFGRLRQERPASAVSTVVCVLEPKASAEPQFSGGTLSRPSRVRVLVPWPVADTFKRTKWQLFLWPCHVLLDAVPCIGACVLGCQDLECGLTGGTWFPWPLRPSPICARFTLVIAVRALKTVNWLLQDATPFGPCL